MEIEAERYQQHQPKSFSINIDANGGEALDLKVIHLFLFRAIIGKRVSARTAVGVVKPTRMGLFF